MRKLGCLLLVLSGMAMLVHGGLLRRVPVLVTEERQLSVFVPSLDTDLPLPAPAAAEGDNPFGQAAVPATGDNPFGDAAGTAGGPADGNPFGNAATSKPADADNPFESAAAAADDNPFQAPPAGDAAGQTTGGHDRPPPGMTSKTVTQKHTALRLLAESTIIRDVSVGGLERQPNGVIRRTYTGLPPSLCPT